MICKRLTEFLGAATPTFVDFGDADGGFLLFLILFLLGYSIVYAILTVLWLVSRPICWMIN
jgi:hypothetical protein